MKLMKPNVNYSFRIEHITESRNKQNQTQLFSTVTYSTWSICTPISGYTVPCHPKRKHKFLCYDLFIRDPQIFSEGGQILLCATVFQIDY